MTLYIDIIGLHGPIYTRKSMENPMYWHKG